MLRINIYEFKFWELWIIILIFYLILAYLTNTYIYTDDFYHYSYFGQLDSERIQAVIDIHNRYQLISYLFIPVILICKVGIIAGGIFTCLFLLNKGLEYKNCLKIALLAELINFLAAFARDGWLILYSPGSFDEIATFSPLAITQLLNLKAIPKYFFYPLQLFNLFEIAYWLILAYGTMKMTKMNFGESFKVVASSYGLTLFMWVLLVLYLQVQFT